MLTVTRLLWEEWKIGGMCLDNLLADIQQTQVSSWSFRRSYILLYIWLIYLTVTSCNLMTFLFRSVVDTWYSNTFLNFWHWVMQAYTLELEAEVAKLKELNEELQKKQVM